VALCRGARRVRDALLALLSASQICVGFSYAPVDKVVKPSWTPLSQKPPGFCRRRDYEELVTPAPHSYCLTPLEGYER
jgi:hypothetical protein